MAQELPELEPPSPVDRNLSRAFLNCILAWPNHQDRREGKVSLFTALRGFTKEATK